MKSLLFLWLMIVTGLSGLAQAGLPDPIAQKPLFTAGTVKHNIIFALDDSGSMYFDTLFPTDQGRAYWDTTRHSFGDPGNMGSIYLNTEETGGFEKKETVNNFWQSGADVAIPPVSHYGFARSTLYNRGYYDYTVNYDPWPSYGGYTFVDADPTAACYDPYLTANENADPVSCDSGKSVDLTVAQTRKFRVEVGMACDDDCPAGSKTGPVPCSESCLVDTNNPPDGTVNRAKLDFDYWVPTYYVGTKAGTFKIEEADVPDVGGSGGVPGAILAHSQSATTAKTVTVEGLSGDSLTIFVRADTTGNPSVESYFIDDVVVVKDSGSPIWLEDFSNPTGDWTANTAQAAARYDGPIAEVNGNVFRFADLSDGHPRSGGYLAEYGEWITQTIDISAASNVSFSLRLWGSGDFESSGRWEDRIEVWYQVENAAGVDFCTLSGGTYTCDCANHASSDPMATDLFAAWEKNPPAFSDFTGDLTLADFAIGPDGRCLQRVEIKDPAVYGSDYDSYPSGRDYAGEIQNFANWFQFYRKRSQSMRGGLARAMEGVSGVQAGVFWINNQRDIDFDPNNPGGSTMWDWDADKARDPSYFLEDVYGKNSSGGTPLRTALNHAGSQYGKTGGTAPITEICQQNFTILFTDGFHNGANASVGNADSGAGAPYADSYSETLGDVAMYYYDTRLRTDLPAGGVPTDAQCPIPAGDPPNPADCNADLHMNTYTVGLGALGQDFFDKTHNNVSDAYAVPPTWVNPTNNTPEMIDDLYHAAVNGRGEINNADTPAELANALQSALTDIAGIIGSSSSASFNTGKLEAGAMLYQSLLNSNNWSGTVQAYEIDPANGQLVDADTSDLGLDPDWDAATRLDARDIATNPRVILTYGGSAGVPFQWSDLTAAQQADLNTDSDGSPDGNGTARLDFIRGDTTNEGTGLNFRNRVSRLGDISDSQAQYIGGPKDPWPDGGAFPSGADAYSAFKGTHATRDGVIYVGGNDGMLHGFWGEAIAANPAGGEEAIAYIPSTLFSTGSDQGLHYLTESGYNHRFYVNLTPTVTDAFINTGSGDAWHSVLVGGLRNGGRGMFALDVTDPTTFEEAKAADLVLWEFDSSDDADLGHTFSQAIIVKLNNGEWGAIFGNGYNDSGSGKAQLFILSVEDGSVMAKLDTGAGSTGDRNGLSRPAVADIDGDFVADRVYAGDLYGNLWAFDISDADPSNWAVAYYNDSGTPAPLFKADTSTRGDTPNSFMHQAITSAPTLALHPTQPATADNQPNLLVMFGTGQYIVSPDNNTACPDGSTGPCAQSFYVVWDRGEGDPLDTARFNLDYADLVRQEITEATYQVDSVAYLSRTVSANPVNYSTAGVYGCYLDFPAEKERLVTKPVVRGYSVLFNTIIPSQGACSGGGDGWLMTMDYSSCGANDAPVFDVNQDGAVDDSDKEDTNDHVLVGKKMTGGMPSGVSILGDYRYTTSTNSTDVQVDRLAPLQGGGREGRLSWEELMR